MAEQIIITIVDDEQDMRESISQWLSLSGYKTETYASADLALKDIGPDYPGIIISDIKMPGTDGISFLKKLPVLISSSMRVRSCNTLRPAPMCKCPTSEFPIWPAGKPTASPQALINVFGCSLKR